MRGVLCEACSCARRAVRGVLYEACCARRAVRGVLTCARRAVRGVLTCARRAVCEHCESSQQCRVEFAT
eukprot:801689-Prymnesium_polylepis.1